MSNGPFIAASVRMQFHTPDGKFIVQLEDDGEITVWESEIPAIGNRFEASVEEMDAIVNTYLSMKACMTETKGLVRAHEDKQREYNHEVMAAEETTRLQEEAHRAAEAVGAKLVYPNAHRSKDHREMGKSEGWVDHVRWGQPKAAVDAPKTREDVIREVVEYAVGRIAELLEKPW